MNCELCGRPGELIVTGEHTRDGLDHAFCLSHVGAAYERWPGLPDWDTLARRSVKAWANSPDPRRADAGAERADSIAGIRAVIGQLTTMARRQRGLP